MDVIQKQCSPKKLDLVAQKVKCEKDSIGVLTGRVTQALFDEIFSKQVTIASDDTIQVCYNMDGVIMGKHNDTYCLLTSDTVKYKVYFNKILTNRLLLWERVVKNGTMWQNFVSVVVSTTTAPTQKNFGKVECALLAKMTKT
jgi:hypothetical protein